MKISRFLLFGSLAGLVLAPIPIEGLSQAETRPEYTITVQPGKSIQAAIDAAPAGAVICLGEGEWLENIKITKSLTLKGQGSGRSVIRAKEEDQPVVRISSPEEIYVVIEKLAMTGAEDWLDGCGIIVEGTAQAIIIGSTVYGNVVGIKLLGSAQATITESTVSENEFGIWLEDSAQATISGNTVSGNKYGIVIWRSAQATISGNVIAGNSGSGVIFFSTGEVRGEGNEMRANGVDLMGDLPGALRLPLVEATEAEIVFPDGRYPTLQHAVDALLPKGRLILQGGEYEAGLTITKELTIVAQEGAEVTLRARSRGAPVLSLVRGAKLSATGLKVTGGSHGFLLEADAQVTITGSTVSENEYGIVLRGMAQVTITDSTVFRNGGNGIVLTGSAQATITKSTVSENGHDIWRGGNAQDRYGIWLGGTAQATIIGSTVSKNSLGILLEDSAQATITDTTVFGNGGNGIVLMGSAQATITGSSVFGNGYSSWLLLDRYGIWLGDTAQATIIGSPVSRNAWFGIVLGGSAQATIEENEIFANKLYGVALGESPCFSTVQVFTGYVTGKANIILDNLEGDVCPPELSFLITEEGGELDRRQ